MPLSTNTYTYNGGPQTFAATFADGYIERDHVTAYRVGDFDGLGEQIYLDFTWNSDAEILVTNSLTNGDEIVVQRTVPKDAQLVDLSSEGGLTRESLERNARQSLHAVHEVLDGRTTDIENIDLLVAQAEAAAQQALDAVATVEAVEWRNDGAVVTAAAAVINARNGIRAVQDAENPNLVHLELDGTGTGGVDTSNVYAYPDRATFIADLPNQSFSVGDQVVAGTHEYVFNNTSTHLPQLTGFDWVGQPTPHHFGAVGDGVTDDTSALIAWKNHIAIISSVAGVSGLRGPLPDLDLRGFRYGVSETIDFVIGRGAILKNGVFIAIGNTWSGAADFVINWDSAYGRIQNVRVHCDRKCSGIRIDAGRVKVFQTEVYEYLGHGALVPDTSGPEVWFDQCIIGELDVSYNLTLFRDNASYVGTGIEIRRSDCKVSNTTIRWTRCCYRATAGIQDIYNCHFYNGGVGEVLRNNNQLIDWRGSVSNELTINNLYHDNGFSEFATDRVNINNISIIQDGADMAPTAALKFIAYAPSTPARVNINNVEVRQWTVGAKLVEFADNGANTWAPTYNVLEQYFDGFIDANRNNFSFSASAKPLQASFQAHDDREFRYASNGILTRLGMMDANTTQDSMPYVGSFGDMLQLGAPNDVVRVASEALRMDAQSETPDSTASYLIAMSDGTASTDNFGGSGAGPYWRNSAGSWSPMFGGGGGTLPTDPTFNTLTVGASGTQTVIASTGFITGAAGASFNGFLSVNAGGEFNGALNMQTNNIVGVRAAGLLPQSSLPTAPASALIASDGTSTTERLGAAGPGLYYRRASGEGFDALIGTQERLKVLTGTSVSLDFKEASVFSINTTGNTTVSFVDPPNGHAYGFTVRVQAGGSHTITWPASVVWANGVEPDDPASGQTNIYVFLTTNGGSPWFGFLAGENMS